MLVLSLHCHLLFFPFFCILERKLAVETGNEAACSSGMSGCTETASLIMQALH